MQVNVKKNLKIQCNVHGMSETECLNNHCHDIENAKLTENTGSRSVFYKVFFIPNSIEIYIKQKSHCNKSCKIRNCL